MEPKILGQGKVAVQMAKGLIPLMLPIRYGSTTIKVGTIDRQQKLWILGQAGGLIYYIYEDKLKTLGRDEFLHGYFIGQVAKEAYQRTAWLVPVITVIVSFSVGMVAGFFAIGGLIGGIVVTGIKIGTLINAHPKEIEIIRKHLPTIIYKIKWFEINCPTLYKKMSAVVSKGVWVALSQAPSGVTAQDIADVLGRILGGAGRVVSGEVVEVTVFTGLWNVVGRPLIAAALHLPGAVVRGTVQQREAVAKAIIVEIKKQKINVSPAEATAISRELSLVKDALLNLDTLQRALKEIEPAMNTLEKKWNKMSKEVNNH